MTVRQMTGQVDVSTIDYREGDMDDIEEADEPMTVNATETENKDESIVETDRDTSHKSTNRDTLDSSSNVKDSSQTDASHCSLE